MMPARHVLVSGALALAVGAALVAPAHGQIYRYVDERGTAAYADGLDAVPERYRASAVATGLTNRPAPPPPPAQGERPVAAGGTTIKFTAGQRIVADARINGTVPVKLLLDTGADRTLIAPRALTAAGASLGRPVVSGQVRGVTGRTQVDAVTIESLEIGQARVGRMLVLAHDTDIPGFDGLLGRDFLDRFSVTIDPAKGLVTIAPR
ncbi:MAG: retropepsin-like domain-containing protein [Candidatus Rokubacteria bacterium]|nr:retropepsin-like domain-containing protein [Candidatus Rokubacteria bacterium]